MTELQQGIYDFLKENGESSKAGIAITCIGFYYTNGMDHFGKALSRMVINKSIQRTKKGYYKIIEE
jgi:hypothetical protein